jgi:hypothetical protein
MLIVLYCTGISDDILYVLGRHLQRFQSIIILNLGCASTLYLLLSSSGL